MFFPAVIQLVKILLNIRMYTFFFLSFFSRQLFIDCIFGHLYGFFLQTRRKSKHNKNVVTCKEVTIHYTRQQCSLAVREKVFLCAVLSYFFSHSLCPIFLIFMLKLVSFVRMLSFCQQPNSLTLLILIMIIISLLSFSCVAFFLLVLLSYSK